MTYLTFREEARINKNNLDLRFCSHFNGETSFEKLSLELCRAEFLSKKEYCESVEVARILRRFIKGEQKTIVYDICGGHGFVGILLAALNPSVEKAYIVDVKKPLSFERAINCVSKAIPEAKDKIVYVNQDYKTVDYAENAFLIGIHACGELSDSIQKLAIKRNLNAAIVPCCYKKYCLPEKMHKFIEHYDLQSLVDFNRLTRSYNAGYNVSLRLLPEKITPMNKVFIHLKPD